MEQALEDASISPDEAVDKYPAEELRKALNIIGILDQKGVEKVKIIGHSEGAVNAVIAAVLRSDFFMGEKGALFLDGPAGLIGEDKFTRLLKGFAGQSKRAKSLAGIPATEDGPGWPEIPMTDTEKEVASAAMTEAIKYMAKNPVRAFREGRDIARSQIHDMLRYLHEKGVGIVVMAGVDDPVFPMERMNREDDGIVKADMLDGFLSVRGGHGR